MANSCSYEEIYSSPFKRLRRWYDTSICNSVDPVLLSNLLIGTDDGEYGSVTKDMNELSACAMKFKDSLSLARHSASVHSTPSPSKLVTSQKQLGIPVVVLDSDEEEGCENVNKIRSNSVSEHKPYMPDVQRVASLHEKFESLFQHNFNEFGSNQCISNPVSVDGWKSANNLEAHELGVSLGNLEGKVRDEALKASKVHTDTQNDTLLKLDNGFKRDIVLQAELLENHQNDVEDNDNADIWNDMDMALGSSVTSVPDGGQVPDNGGKTCEHSLVMEDDLGLYCKSCGVVLKSIDMIFEYQWKKVSKSTKTSSFSSQYVFSTSEELDKRESDLLSNPSNSIEDLSLAELPIHPRHAKQMRAHQLEGFSFLQKNLLIDKPGGCILAHAPGSGKTMLVISFIQSFLTKYPNARPLIVLPKGIIETWRKEFQKWRIEDIPLCSLYKAESRSRQLHILKNWKDQRSILLSGYKQFSSIICDADPNKLTAACQEILLKVPGLLILDEGHTPRNEDTDVLHSLAKVLTPRKVVLSGTLFQNHVKEVFNIVKLVRPNFFKLESSRAVVRHISSRIKMVFGGKRIHKTQTERSFSDLVEEALQSDDPKLKATVIQELRKLTNDMLHYYRGDFLDELPGLLDFTVILNLSQKQKVSVQEMEKVEGGKFKRSFLSSAIYMHPCLKEVQNADVKKIDELIKKMDVNDGIKTKFFLNILSLTEKFGEKLLVFGQYLRPLQFLERLVILKKGWSLGKEIFEISGDSKPVERAIAEEQFNESPNAKVLFGSIKACGEGISLVGASRVLFLDVHLNPSVTRQAVGRAFRPGQNKKVYVYRMVAADSPEEEDHITSFRKELISKVWFEWTEQCAPQAFQMVEIDISDSDDTFLESPLLKHDIKTLYRR
ncbi:protein CHROMATIN REMODELING 35-like [Nymphaea colorata]|nr:protein CHROMATIN REMODELING 35-like [Nymphaea colorata]XP_031485462.1 protein CHROMATIN REMODELING 35-like [Nymphaea colorata]